MNITIEDARCIYDRDLMSLTIGTDNNLSFLGWFNSFNHVTSLILIIGLFAQSMFITELL